MVNGKNYVLKRDGRKEEVHFDKITSRIQKLCYRLNMDIVDPVSITLKVIGGLYPGVTTVELDTLAAETAIVMGADHPDYATLAARIAVSNLQKQTKKHFSDVISDLYHAVDPQTGEKTPLISDQHYEIIMKNASRLNSCIVYDRDFSYNYFAFKLLERSYLFKINGKTVERPQHMLMRVAVGIHGEDIDSAIETYNYMSEGYFIHSSATLLTAGTPYPYLPSTYSIAMPDDSLEGIYECISNCIKISNTTGRISVHIQNIRAKGTEIAGTNGVSNGLVPMLRVFNNSAWLNRQSENQPSNQAIFLEPWHADILDFLNLKRTTGKDEYRARDLQYALWVPDLFMHRVKNDEKWSLMCPHQAQGLPNCWGQEFEKLYEKYESEGRFVKQIPARDVWRAICVSQMETGSPYILYKDACNKKSNQQNLGTIKSSSLSTESIQYSSSDEIAACITASVALNMFVNPERNGYDFEKLKQVVKTLTKNLNKAIDVSAYPSPEARTSNLRHRPIGIGVQGLADTFILLRMPFESPEARSLNVQIFETLYYAALEASSEIAERDGPYSTYDGSPLSQGRLQYDMWGVEPTKLWDWVALKQRIAKHGVRNSLLVALIPTISTAQILGNNQSIEPYLSNVQVRRVNSSEFRDVNQHLLKDLTERGLWTSDLKQEVIERNGSVQNIAGIPDDLKCIYKTVWEIPQKIVIEMAADRGAFIDQSQAMNVHIGAPSYAVMSSMHFYGWQKGLKTGMYNLRTNPVSVVQNGNRSKVSVVQENGEKSDDMKKSPEEDAALQCSLQNPGACEMCSA
ncbi:ribonucleoside-diphosphate reductase large subunit [Tribolium castaneum]|uniref:Ribonucleoside-diphosphate reductase n=1 Tax=Tribolium castaneum TaxID=7070 RepID=D2A2I2_TRICA|nr:PREDICTED: ribonucleoside-diphosphate reductase large subunit [Tribolium castaneum]EFA02203.1 Ribonucleoside-diphosphate reductase large subunit-like Protein [Tribolium castaneum]|eukprot:XP_968743.1 PREDICTED: ribonucleoside-diphosphate reductase large subunit [Tribolium castaneum]